MEFLGIGPAELLFIAIITLIVIGPRDISKTARTIGRFLNRMYRSETWRAITQASRNLRNLPNQLAREAALEDMKDIQDELRETQSSLNEQVRGLQSDLRDTEKNIQEPIRDLDSELKSWKPDKDLPTDPASPELDDPSDGSQE
jgi:sec-independent protein translocase protein TatB